MADSKRSQVERPDRQQAASERGASRLGDSTRPIAIDRRLTSSRRGSRALMFAAGGVAVAFGLALFYAPVQNYLAQSDDLDTKSEQLAQLRDINQELENEVERLDTADGIEEAAREELGYQNPDEERITVVDPGLVPTDLPPGWPYDLVSGIVETKRRTG